MGRIVAESAPGWQRPRGSDLHSKALEFSHGRQLTVQEEAGDFLEAGLVRHLVNVVAAIHQAGIGVDPADFGFAGEGDQVLGNGAFNMTRSNEFSNLAITGPAFRHRIVIERFVKFLPRLHPVEPAFGRASFLQGVEELARRFH